MTGSLLHVSHRPGQQSVRRPAFLRRRLLIADGCQQRVDEAHALVFKHEDPLANGHVEPIADGIGAADDGNDERDGRSASHGHGEHDIADLAGQTRETLAEQRAETVGHAEARSTPQVCSRARQLQREVRVAPGSLMEQSHVGRAELSFQTLSEELLQGALPERAQRPPRDPLPGKRALELERHSRVRLLAQGHEDTDRLLAQSAHRHLNHRHRRRV